MPLSSVIALDQDADGVLWLGTFDGVATFDGPSIEQVPDIEEAPRRGSIASILARREGGVLVVDDLAVNRAVLSRMLSAIGIEVIEASTWIEAVAAWRSTRPQLIWMIEKPIDAEAIGRIFERWLRS